MMQMLSCMMYHTKQVSMHIFLPSILSSISDIIYAFTFSGSIREGDNLMLGPYDDGQFQNVTVKTVHRHRLPCRLIQAGQASTAALVNVERENLRKVNTMYSIWVTWNIVYSKDTVHPEDTVDC